MTEFRGREWPPKEGNKASAGWPMWKHVFHEVFEGKDNDDYVHKTIQMTKYTATTSAFISCGEITFLELRGLKAARAIGRWALPIIGGGIAYTTTAAFLGGIRNKTEAKHHFMAGQVAGAIYGASRKSFMAGLLWGLVLGLTGMVYKDASINGYTFVGDFDPDGREVGWSWSHKQDYTLYKDYPGYWVKEAPKEDNCEK